MNSEHSMTTSRLSSNAWRRTAIKVAAVYVLAAGLWIVFSDRLLFWVVSRPEDIAFGQSVKGVGFVLVTGGLLFGYLSRCLRRQQETFDQLATLFDSLPAIVYVADLESHELLYVNRFTSDRFGSDWQGRACYGYLQNGQQQPCHFCPNPMLTRDGQPGPAIIWEFRNTIDNRWYECLDKALRWPDGRLVRVEIAFDITHRKELEQIKDELLSTVSHEMRTPLTAITGFSELLIDEPTLTEPVRHHVRTIYREAEKMQELIETFLEVRRLKTDRARVDYEVVPVRSLVEQSIAGEHAARHEIVASIPPDLAVYGNRRELTQVMRQLVANACRFSPEGTRVTLQAETRSDQVRITVTDTGTGIPTEDRERIFEPFHRLDVGDRRRTRGVGLGLTLVREIVALHGGGVAVEGTEGDGSSFVLNLPLPGQNMTRITGESSTRQNR